ncbi:acetyltransferase [Actinoplanes sp. SE50]|uniref:GNAT family N-acetyltransferase n=1 Tax=unclassified Actinoplanes TaxID=2626549 RepID=UPI00023EBB7E|nr:MULTISPECIES: GNAT family N-acetyltransferase [unclassified Actinoplanes]AEV83987.1 GCN5-related N-acetyltransferase [Actinoplanes sp. SE50/110]ATO82380.1 acetyltransferase [Actinoplanes sp. SE50]SLL99787.1 acetyltransferase [Actinoplanes sp. SE50/110]
MEITTWYLEQTAPGPATAAAPAVPVRVERAEIPSPELSRFLYTAVGGDWNWTDRLAWTWQQWHDHLARPGVQTWVASVRGTPCGYFELDGTRPGSVEIVYFGLLPSFTGQRIGGFLLDAALARAWALNPSVARVWVHTCSLDGPAALPNYQARGMSLYRTETTTVPVPAEPPGPWPGAHRETAAK